MEKFFACVSRARVGVLFFVERIGFKNLNLFFPVLQIIVIKILWILIHFFQLPVREIRLKP